MIQCIFSIRLILYLWCVNLIRVSSCNQSTLEHIVKLGNHDNIYIYIVILIFINVVHFIWIPCHDNRDIRENICMYIIYMYNEFIELHIKFHRLSCYREYIKNSK